MIETVARGGEFQQEGRCRTCGRVDVIISFFLFLPTLLSSPHPTFLPHLHPIPSFCH